MILAVHSAHAATITLPQETPVPAPGSHRINQRLFRAARSGDLNAAMAALRQGGNAALALGRGHAASAEMAALLATGIKIQRLGLAAERVSPATHLMRVLSAVPVVSLMMPLAGRPADPSTHSPVEQLLAEFRIAEARALWDRESEGLDPDAVLAQAGRGFDDEAQAQADAHARALLVFDARADVVPSQEEFMAIPESRNRAALLYASSQAFVTGCIQGLPDVVSGFVQLAMDPAIPSTERGHLLDGRLDRHGPPAVHQMFGDRERGASVVLAYTRAVLDSALHSSEKTLYLDARWADDAKKGYTHGVLHAVETGNHAASGTFIEMILSSDLPSRNKADLLHGTTRPEGLVSRACQLNDTGALRALMPQAFIAMDRPDCIALLKGTATLEALRRLFREDGYRLLGRPLGDEEIVDALRKATPAGTAFHDACAAADTELIQLFADGVLDSPLSPAEQLDVLIGGPDPERGYSGPNALLAALARDDGGTAMSIVLESLRALQARAPAETRSAVMAALTGISLPSPGERIETLGAAYRRGPDSPVVMQRLQELASFLDLSAADRDRLAGHLPEGQRLD